MLDLTEDVHVVCLWFVAWKQGDYLATVTKSKDGELHMKYRFRYYDPDNPGPWGNHDKKSWTEGTIRDKSESRAIGIVDMIVEVLRETSKADICDKILVNGDGAKAFALMREKPWCHVKLASEHN